MAFVMTPKEVPRSPISIASHSVMKPGNTSAKNSILTASDTYTFCLITRAAFLLRRIP